MAIRAQTNTKTLAGAALAGGRYALGRSFRFHRPRGAFCHSGWCQQCKVRLSDGRNVLACRAPASDLALFEKPSGLLRFIGVVAEFFPPWFHEKKMLRPRFLRQAYFWLLRRLSGALPLPEIPKPADAKTWHERKCGSLVVGAGVAGMTAAIELARNGRDVLLVESEALGGSANQCARHATMLGSLRKEIEQLAIAVLEHTTCVGLYDGAKRALLVGEHDLSIASFDELIVATGAYDRLPAFKGNDRPGIIGLRAFERLLQTNALPASLRVGLFVSPDHEERAVAALSDANRIPAWVASSGTLRQSRYNAISNARIVRSFGSRGINGIVLENGARLKCDLLVLGFSQPSYELQLQAGKDVMFDRISGTVRVSGQAQIPVVIVGEAAGATTVEAAVVHAKQAIEMSLSGQTATLLPSSECPVPAVASSEAFICACEDVRVKDVERAMDDGFLDIEHIKRRTGAGTGPCQGKLCHPELARCLSERGVKVSLPTIRPLLRPMPLAEFLIENRYSDPQDSVRAL